MANDRSPKHSMVLLVPQVIPENKCTVTVTSITWLVRSFSCVTHMIINTGLVGTDWWAWVSRLLHWWPAFDLTLGY